jgi:hypothetical protein
MTQGSAEALPFEISGEVTAYRGENYLLARSAMRGARTPEAAKTGGGAAESGAATPPSLAAGNGAGVAEQQPRPAGPESVATTAPAEDVLARMKQLAPARTTMEPDAPQPGEAGDDVSSGSAEMFEGTPIVRRIGRIVPQGDGWAFAFDTDHAQDAEQPLRLLPNQSLQFMVELYERNPAGLVFTISGEVTDFSGRNYVLARSVTRRLDLGNLRR